MSGLLSVTEVDDVLLELATNDVSLGRRRELVQRLRDYHRHRSSSHAAQEIMDGTGEAVRKLQESVTSMQTELALWRPVALPAIEIDAKAKKAAVDASNDGLDARKDWRQIASRVLTPTNVLLVILALLVAFFGLRAELPGGVSLERPVLGE